MSDETIQPKDMNWIEKGVFGVEWSDGHKGVYPIRYLRLHCPCAACTDEWTGELKLKDEDIPMLMMVKDIEQVGNYALRFIWSDGDYKSVCIQGVEEVLADSRGRPCY